jgi:hypothetical protein
MKKPEPREAEPHARDTQQLRAWPDSLWAATPAVTHFSTTGGHDGPSLAVQEEEEEDQGHVGRCPRANQLGNPTADIQQLPDQFPDLEGDVSEDAFPVHA